MNEAYEKARGLRCWSGPVEPVQLGGGITNLNYLVEDGSEKFVVRIGGDIPLHQVMRFNETAASKAAFLADISPEVVHQEPGALVIRFIEGRTYQETDVVANLERILPVIQKCHTEMPKHVRGPALIFWVFHVLRSYADTVRTGRGRRAEDLPRLMEIAATLEKTVGAIDLVYGHNDLLAANFIDDGEKVWLIDWDYAGFNSPLFDLGGIASNNGLTPDQEEWLLESYFDRSVTDELRHRYQAMKCASLLRETMWSMVSELHSEIEFDYPAYTDTNLETFEQAYRAFSSLYK